MRYLEAGKRHAVRFTLNGELVEGEAEPRLLLSDFLRQTLGAYGTHVGCEHGSCGACTIRVDGKAVRACLLYAVQMQDRAVTTVEGLAAPDGVNALQAALQKHHGLQCGFCTPGFLMLAVGILEREPNIGEKALREVLSSNLCRCTGYVNIVKAVRAAAAEMSGAKR